MFFSPRLLYPIFAVFSFAVASFATPVAKPETNLVARQSDVLSTVQSFQGTVSPLIDQLSEHSNGIYVSIVTHMSFSAQAAATGNDPSPVVDQISAAFADATDKLNHFGPSALVDVDATAVINVSIDVVVVSA